MQFSVSDLLNDPRCRESTTTDKMAVSGAAGSPPTHTPLLSAWRRGCRCDGQLPRRTPRRTSAAVSLADRRLGLPEIMNTTVGDTAGCQGRVSACQCEVPFYDVGTQSCRGRVTRDGPVGIRECGQDLYMFGRMINERNKHHHPRKSAHTAHGGTRRPLTSRSPRTPLSENTNAITTRRPKRAVTSVDISMSRYPKSPG